MQLDLFLSQLLHLHLTVWHLVRGQDPDQWLHLPFHHISGFSHFKQIIAQ